MPSPAAARFFRVCQKGEALTSAALRLGHRSADRQVLLHASLATIVAAWDQYVRTICQDFFSVTGRLADAGFQNLHATLSLQYQQKEKKFNTPNFENSRNLIVECTGFDPYTHWSWKNRRWPVARVQTFLNEVLKVRHSFAHGGTMPSYTWNVDVSGNPNLNKKAVTDIQALLQTLVKNTDKGLSLFLKATFIVSPPW
ncbi:MAG: HEPN domain-containing protein [Rhodoferax sp.]